MKLAKRLDNQFAEVVKMIYKARYNAIRSVTEYVYRRCLCQLAALQNI